MFSFRAWFASVLFASCLFSLLWHHPLCWCWFHLWHLGSLSVLLPSFFVSDIARHPRTRPPPWELAQVCSHMTWTMTRAWTQGMFQHYVSTCFHWFLDLRYCTTNSLISFYVARLAEFSAICGVEALGATSDRIARWRSWSNCFEYSRSYFAISPSRSSKPRCH